MSRARAVASALVAAFILGACASPIEPTPSPRAEGPAASLAFASSCSPKPLVPGDGPYLTCASAIDAALRALPPVHADIATATFHYDCPPDSDCAAWLFGVVDLRFVNAPQVPVIVRVSLGSDGHVSATPIPQIIQNQ